MLRKRYVKRLIRKLLLLTLFISIICYITTKIVLDVLNKDKKLDIETETIVPTDQNGDPVTDPYKAPYVLPKTYRRPRPPIQVREILPSDEELYNVPYAQGERRDWHDYVQMETDRQRVGMGEHGQPSYLQDESMKEVEQRMSLENGFNALLSDNISVNRSVPDVRKEPCKSKWYLSKLPSVSIVIPFHNEHFSVLLRTLHSIVNRSPAELLKEIIIVDDGSEREYLKAQLNDYIAENFPKLVHIVRLSNRSGLISARLAGAKQATADVLIFFDSHIECNYNWLPPLLEPIALNEKISTCPIVDTIDHATFAYSGGYQDGSRGAFDWSFHYKQLPALAEDLIDPTKPYKNPIMMGGLFAINRKFFWVLGGYDPGLEIWGAEQYEISFKIWMCGGMLLDVPCSRVAHIFRGPWENKPNPKSYNFVARNHKRVAEVWLDEYKEYVYNREPETYENIDAGDLNELKALREKLKCKSFKWFLEVIAPDLLKTFPPIPPPSYASGILENLGYNNYCLDSMGKGNNYAVGLYYCAQNKTNPQRNQFWELSYSRDMRLRYANQCLDVQDTISNATVWMWSCHNQGGNQFWYYDREHKWLIHGKHKINCLEAILDSDGKYKVVVNHCNINNYHMKWEFGILNNTALDHFYDDLI